MVGGGVGAGACWCEAHEARAKPAKAVREAIILVSFMVNEGWLPRVFWESTQAARLSATLKDYFAGAT